MSYIMLVTLSKIDIYLYAKEHATWAMKEYHAISKGDEVYLIVGVHTLTQPIPRGFPRLKSYDGVEVQVEEFWKVQVTSDCKMNLCSPVAETHPYSFDFELIESQHDFPLEDLGKPIVESVRKLYTTNKSIMRLPIPRPIIT